MRQFFYLAAVLFLAGPFSIAAEEQTRMDVMIVYTPAVTGYYNGHDGVLAHLLATVAGANAALENSGAEMFYNLVHAAEVAYVEGATMSDDLTRLQESSDGYMDEIHAWRDAWGADLVCLLRRGSVGGNSGLAYLLSDETGMPAWAFSVVSDAGAASDFIFAHELGHNLGGGHAHGDTSPSSIFPYSHGHRFYGQDSVEYRTVMAYAPGARIPHFSNPLVFYQGVATGIPAEESNPADIVLTFAETGPVVAGYRVEQNFLPEILRQPRDITIPNGNRAFLTATVNGVPPLDLQWFQGAAGDTSQPVAGATEAVLQTAPLSSSGRYWLRVQNAEGTADSRAATVAVVSHPPGPYATTVEQPDAQNGFRVDDGLWQVVVPPAGYWNALAVKLWKVGDPGDIRARITDAAGFLVSEHTIPSSAVTIYSDWVNVTVGTFLVPGQAYRIRLSPSGFFSDDDTIFWGGADGGYPNGASSVEEFFPGYAFSFRARGAPAWTYQTWLADEGLDGSTSEPDASPTPGGLPNLLRYVLNVDSVSQEGGMPAAGAPVSAGGEEYLPFQFRQRKAMADVSVTVEASEDLQQWSAVSTSYLVQLPDDDEETARFEARVPLSSGEESKFLRLNASLPQL